MSGIRHFVAGAARGRLCEPSEEMIGRRHTATLSADFSLRASFSSLIFQSTARLP
jgi:hypothetical protein